MIRKTISDSVRRSVAAPSVKVSVVATLTKTPAAKPTWREALAIIADASHDLHSTAVGDVNEARAEAARALERVRAWVDKLDSR